MPVKKHLFLMGIFSTIVISCSCVSWAATPINRKSVLLPSTNELLETTLQKDTSTGAGKINGTVTNTAGSPLPDIGVTGLVSENMS